MIKIHVQNVLMQKRQLQLSVTDVSCIEKGLLKQYNNNWDNSLRLFQEREFYQDSSNSTQDVTASDQIF